MAKDVVIHFAGGLRLERGQRVIKIGAGFPACTSGPRAIRIANNGAQSWWAHRVTCKKCIKLLDERDAMGKGDSAK